MGHDVHLAMITEAGVVSPQAFKNFSAAAKVTAADYGLGDFDAVFSAVLKDLTVPFHGDQARLAASPGTPVRGGEEAQPSYASTPAGLQKQVGAMLT